MGTGRRPEPAGARRNLYAKGLRPHRSSAGRVRASACPPPRDQPLACGEELARTRIAHDAQRPNSEAGFFKLDGPAVTVRLAGHLTSIQSPLSASARTTAGRSLVCDRSENEKRTRTTALGSGATTPRPPLDASSPLGKRCLAQQRNLGRVRSRAILQDRGAAHDEPKGDAPAPAGARCLARRSPVRAFTSPARRPENPSKEPCWHKFDRRLDAPLRVALGHFDGQPHRLHRSGSLADDVANSCCRTPCRRSAR